MVVGVWVGNSDNTPMVHSTGITGAAPIWHDFMEKAVAGRPVRDFPVPPGIVKLRIGGKDEFFAEGQLPRKEHNDNPFKACADLSKVKDQELRKWLEQNCPNKGKPQATPTPKP